MSIKSNNNKAIAPWTDATTPLPRLVQWDGTKKLYYPLILPSGSITKDGYKYSYIRSIGDTFGIALSNTKYVIPNVKAAIIEAYDIPAGTYSPSIFETLIRSFISQNGSRTVSNSFSVVVNGQTYSVPAGRAVCFTYQYGGQARFVSFNGSQRGRTDFQNGFSSRGVYCTYWVYSDIQGDKYRNFNIVVNTGIKFN